MRNDILSNLWHLNCSQKKMLFKMGFKFNRVSQQYKSTRCFSDSQGSKLCWQTDLVGKTHALKSATLNITFFRWEMIESTFELPNLYKLLSKFLLYLCFHCSLWCSIFIMEGLRRCTSGTLTLWRFLCFICVLKCRKWRLSASSTSSETETLKFLNSFFLSFFFLASICS